MRQDSFDNFFGEGFDFHLDTISWIIPRLAVTDMYGASNAKGHENVYIVNTAAEVNTPYDYKLPVEPHLGADAVREALDDMSDVIQVQMETTDKDVVVHCFAGMERSVLTCAWYLCKYKNMSMEDAYQAIYDVRPVALDRRFWVGYQVPENSLSYEPTLSV